MRAIETVELTIEELKQIKATKLIKSVELTEENAQLIASKRHLRAQITRLKREKAFLAEFGSSLTLDKPISLDKLTLLKQCDHFAN